MSTTSPDDRDAAAAQEMFSTDSQAISEMRRTLEPMAALSQLLSRREAAAHAGVSVRTLDRVIAAGEITVVEIGRRVLIRRSLLEAWIENKERLRGDARRGGRPGRSSEFDELFSIAQPRASRITPPGLQRSRRA